MGVSLFAALESEIVCIVLEVFGVSVLAVLASENDVEPDLMLKVLFDEDVDVDDEDDDVAYVDDWC